SHNTARLEGKLSLLLPLLRRAAKVAFRLRVVAWVLCGLLAAERAHAAFEVNHTDWEDTSELLDLSRAQLGRGRVDIVGNMDYGNADPGYGLLILHPSVASDANQMDAFLEAGGRLALLDDRGCATSSLGRYRIQRIEAPLRPAQTLRGNANLPIAVP